MIVVNNIEPFILSIANQISQSEAPKMSPERCDLSLLSAWRAGGVCAGFLHFSVPLLPSPDIPLDEEKVARKGEERERVGSASIFPLLKIDGNHIG